MILDGGHLAETNNGEMCRRVRTLGFQVGSALNSHAAPRYLQGYPGEIRLLLTDIALRRRMDGYELVDRARTRRRPQGRRGYARRSPGAMS